MLYHKLVFWPKVIAKQMPEGILPCRWTNHARKARTNDRYGVIPHFDKIDMEALDWFEAELEHTRGNLKLVKLVGRMYLGEGNDIVVVILIDERGLRVKTVWINKTNDKHRTLNRRKYATC